jgi:hypothetical protein
LVLLLSTFLRFYRGDIKTASSFLSEIALISPGYIYYFSGYTRPAETTEIETLKNNARRVGVHPKLLVKGILFSIEPRCRSGCFFRFVLRSVSFHVYMNLWSPLRPTGGLEFNWITPCGWFRGVPCWDSNYANLLSTLSQRSRGSEQWY